MHREREREIVLHRKSERERERERNLVFYVQSTKIQRKRVYKIK